MELPPFSEPNDSSLPPFEWSDVFDFTIDDQLLLNLDHGQQPIQPPPPTEPMVDPPAGRVRKRDPRLVCENFLAGRVPCACPEMDAKIEEEERLARGKKRARTTRATGFVRCQVPGCEVDISQLKGYHKRHRVCLRCANSSSVLMDGEDKRYCQQCGKFHVLPDFDEGKRSCRRKLERHNNRRRRKPVNSGAAVEKEIEGDLQTEDVSSDGEAGKENTCSTSQFADREDSKNGTWSNLSSVLESKDIENDSVMTFSQLDKVVDSSKHDHNPPSFDNKSTYSSMCPTGRISFKLYDWNPAEFPRRLRHQIFEWLASMPIELEGYIRPGCTILTAFLSMPQCMWVKLFEDPVSYVQSSVGPGGMLYGRGTALVYLNNMVFRVLKDNTSVVKIDVAVRAPKLHYVYPSCFEAGKPMNFIACGSNLLQPKFRSLISFSGKYLPHDYCVAFPHGKDEGESHAGFDHQFCRIYVPQTEPSFFGPAFIEVENECGLSNFIPILIGDEHVCSEIRTIHKKYDCSYCKKKPEIKSFSSIHGICEVSCRRQVAFSEFLLDVAWLLKWPPSEKFSYVTTLQVQRFNCLLNHLLSNKSTFILQRILHPLQIVLGEIEARNFHSGVNDVNMELFRKHMVRARDFVAKKDGHVMSQAGDSVSGRNSQLQNSLDNHNVSGRNSQLQNSVDNHKLCFDRTNCQVEEVTTNTNNIHLDCPNSRVKGEEDVSLLHGEISMGYEKRNYSRKSCNLMSSKRYINARPLIYMIATIAVCLGVCAVVLHPNKAKNLAITVRRCLFENSY